MCIRDSGSTGSLDKGESRTIDVTINPPGAMIPSGTIFSAAISVHSRVSSDSWSEDLNLVGVESGFFIDPYYWDVVTAGPKRDELIEDLINQIRDMARAGVPMLGYTWMPLGPIRTEPKIIRGDSSGTAFDVNSKNLELLTGLPIYKVDDYGNYLYYNSIAHVKADTVAGVYNKIHLVPMGEYIPLSHFFPKLKNLNLLDINSP